MDTHLLLQELERVNSLPLSKSVRNLIQGEDEGILYLEQFLIEKMRASMLAGATKYWEYVFRQALDLLEAFIRTDPEYRYKVFTVNSDVEDKDEQGWLADEMAAQAENGDDDSLFENLMSNLMSNYNLEPEFPELLF